MMKKRRMKMTSENRNLVDEHLIKKVFINDIKDMGNAVNSIMDLYDKEPVLMKCMVNFTKSTIKHMAMDYPGIRISNPRIFHDISNLCQHFFLKGFRIGQESVRNQFDGILEDLIDIKSAINEDGELPFTGMNGSPEENPESFF